MKSNNYPSIDYLHTRLVVDAEAGLLWWRFYEPHGKRWNTRFAKKPALVSFNKAGYMTGRIDGQGVLAHRVIWAMHYGVWPEFTLDHVNRNKSDNRIQNLRAATIQENNCNLAPIEGASSCFIGVTFDKNSGKWLSRVQNAGSSKHLGCYDSEDEAAFARDVYVAQNLSSFYPLNFPDRRDEAMVAAQFQPRKHSSQYHGVTWHKRSRKWRGQLCDAGKKHYLGSFDHELDAALAYDSAVLSLGLDKPLNTRGHDTGTDRITARIGIKF